MKIAVAGSSIPRGLHHSAPGCGERATLGHASETGATLKGFNHLPSVPFLPRFFDLFGRSTAWRRVGSPELFVEPLVYYLEGLLERRSVA
jgi:hypothetical protein